MTTNKATTASTKSKNAAKLHLKSRARARKSKPIDDEELIAADSVKPFKPSDYLVDHADTQSPFSFAKLLNCWGADFAHDDHRPSYMSCSTQSTNTEELDEELRKLQKEIEAAIARKEQEKAAIEAAKAEKANAEKAKMLLELAQAKKEKEAAIARKKQKKAAAEKVAAEKATADAGEVAVDAHYTQAVIQADKAKKVAEMKDENAVELRRQMEKAKVGVKTTKPEAKWAKKIVFKEVKQSGRALKELRVVTKQTSAACQKYTKFKAAAAKKTAKTEAEKAAVEEEEKQIKDAEDKIHNLREKITATYGMESLIAADNDIDTVLTG